MNNLRKKPTFNELIKYLNNQPIIKYPNRKASNIINDIVISNLLFDDDVFDGSINNKLSTLDKATQKDYPLQNYDLFPDMYHIYDATSKYIPNIRQNRADNINQTIRYMLKHIDTPYSSMSSSPKPPSSDPDPSIHKPTPDPSIDTTPDPSKEPGPVPSDRSPTPPTPVSTEPSASSSQSRISNPIKPNSIHTPTSSPPSSTEEEEEPDVYEILGIPRPQDEIILEPQCFSNTAIIISK